jgi:hypothetical protein
MRAALLLIVALGLAASASVASGVVIPPAPPQAKQLSVACGAATTQIRHAVNHASSAAVRTIETQFQVLRPGTLVGTVAFDASGANLDIEVDDFAPGPGCGHAEGAGQLRVVGPGRSHTVSTLHEKFAAPGRYTLTFTLNQAGRDMLARLGAAQRAYRRHHPHGHQPPYFAWGVGLHYLPVH